ncbi:MAG: bifunctional UDP-sugar hydrolase/5'-nucleotidase [Armatimonadota bacterium]|nr:bifunctional metallophosphatase/5'-nucleotidase [bacterium]
MSRMKFLPVTAVVLLSLVSSGVSVAAQKPLPITLTILHTNDIHGHMFPFDYSKLGKGETDVGGAARRAALIRKLKKESGKRVLVMDAGDVFTRGPLAELHGVPDFAIMNAVPYDIMTLGNNEFKGADGPEAQQIMLDRIKQARFPVVAANVIDASTGKTIVPPYKILNVDGLRIGVFGVTASRVATYEQAKGLTIADPVETAKKTISEMEPKCDFIIALSHLGYPSDIELATRVPRIDVIIGGDSHTWLFQPTLVKHENAQPGWIGGTIICQDGEWGKTVGKLYLTLSRLNDGKFHVERYNSKLVEVNSSIKPATDIEKILAQYTKPFTAKVGNLNKPVPTPEAAEWVAEVIRQAVGAQVGLMPKEDVENGLRAGTVTPLDIRRMFVYPNRISRLALTGKQIEEFTSRTDTALAGAHLRDGMLYIGQDKLDENAKYSVAIEDYYAASISGEAGQAEPGCSIRDAICDHVAENMK